MNPPFNDDLILGKRVAPGWISWFIAITGGGKITQPTVGGSPFTYRNKTIFRQQAILSANALSALAISRDNVTFYTVSTNLGIPITLFPQDYLRISYAGSAPTLTVIPI